MATLETHTVTVTIDAPLAQVAADLADPTTHPSWATEFYGGAVRPAEGGEFTAPVPMMGGEVRHKINADIQKGILDLYFAPPGAPYGPPIPVRLVPNVDGTDLLWTLARFPGVSDQAWQQGLASWPASSRPSSAATRPGQAPTHQEPASRAAGQPGQGGCGRRSAFPTRPPPERSGPTRSR
jgi:hypothetical protein